MLETAGRALADPLGDLLVREAEALLQGAVGLGLFDRIQVGALEVLDQGELEQLAIVLDLADHDRHRRPGRRAAPRATAARRR